MASGAGIYEVETDSAHATNAGRTGTVTKRQLGTVVLTDLASQFCHSPERRTSGAVILSYPSIFAVQAAVAMRFGIETIDLVSHRRGPVAARPRMLVYWLCRHCTLASIADISRALGRDHSTVAHGIRRVDELLRLDAGLAWAAVSLRYELTPREAVA